ncbi:Nif11-like leader peptide family RiPP precursor [Salibacterium sp. K-3]
MSRDRVEEFVNKLKEDKTLAGRLQERISHNSKQAQVDTILQFAGELNFSFTKEDWKTFQQENIQEMNQSGELNEEQMEAVAGGRDTTYGKPGVFEECKKHPASYYTDHDNTEFYQCN